MQFTKLTEELTISPQICVADLVAIHAAGFRAVICNRPDGESADQAEFVTIAASAKVHGIEVHYLPVKPEKIGISDVARFGELLETLPKPVLAYCRTGTRSGMLWTLLSRARQSQAATSSTGAA